MRTKLMTMGRGFILGGWRTWARIEEPKPHLNSGGGIDIPPPPTDNGAQDDRLSRGGSICCWGLKTRWFHEKPMKFKFGIFVCSRILKHFYLAGFWTKHTLLAGKSHPANIWPKNKFISLFDTNLTTLSPYLRQCLLWTIFLRKWLNFGLLFEIFP